MKRTQIDEQLGECGWATHELGERSAAVVAPREMCLFKYSAALAIDTSTSVSFGKPQGRPLIKWDLLRFTAALCTLQAQDRLASWLRYRECTSGCARWPSSGKQSDRLGKFTADDNRPIMPGVSRVPPSSDEFDCEKTV
jgi:hypothetical protein